MTELTPIVIKAEKAAKLYIIMRKSQVHEIDRVVQPKDWLYPTESESLNKKMNTLYLYSQTAARASMGSELE